MSLSVGRIPPYYREVYSRLCGSSEGGRISRAKWQALADTSTLSPGVLDQIWRMCNRGQDTMGQDGTFKSLALIAVAQQGKPVEDKMLDQYAERDLPTPNLASLKEVKEEPVAAEVENSVTVFGYSFHQLQKMDNITVQLVPEKKGIMFKYQEYVVESKVLRVRVVRRFRDFAAFHECLLARFPFRLVPRLPPKKVMGASQQFIERRRKALRRYLLLIRRHPVLRDDEMVRYFFSFNGAEVAQHIKERYKLVQEEYATSEVAKTAKSHITKDMVTRADISKSQTTNMLHTVEKILNVAHHMEERSEALSQDMKVCEKELGAVHNMDASSASIWTINKAELWTAVKKGTRDLSPKLTYVSEKALELHKKEMAVTEKLAYFGDLLMAYQDVCERRERGHSKHSKALTKMQTAHKEKERITSQGQKLSSEEAGRIERRDDELVRAENRNFFAILCLNMELQLVQANLQLLLDVLQDLVDTQTSGHNALHTTWKDISMGLEHSASSGVLLDDSPVLSPKLTVTRTDTPPNNSKGFGDYSPW